MMTRAQLRRTIVDLLVVLVISIIFVSLGSVLSVGKQKKRGQNEYREMFASVLPAERYGILEHELINESGSIDAVYTAYDKADNLTGYIADVKVTSRSGKNLHSYIGIDSDGSTVVGYKVIDDENEDFKAEDLTGLIVSLKGNQMPVALTDSEDNEVIYSEYEPQAGLKDGVYYAQTMKQDKKGYIDYVQIEIKDGRIRRVKWDGINLDPTTGSRTQASLTGAYVTTGENWANQSYNICHALIELQDTSRLAMKSDGKTEIIEGVTTDISAFVNLANECLLYSKLGFNKGYYIETLKTILSTNGVDPEGVTDDDGFIVYSFDDMSLFKRSAEDGEEGYKNIYEMSLSENEKTDPLDIDNTPAVKADEPVENQDLSAEDGLADNYKDSIVSDSVDGIPMSEIRTFLPDVPGFEETAEIFVTSVNEAYKFFKEYMNWMV